ncbi:MAG TPA: hypothetical protein D7H91_05090 [Candidatus Poseidoniales archaeon]|nr:MAG TPA: hypothetical protein D7H91_05090 [Candidatus Poseidoniales archaeon]HII78396.1 hypothetical protein [Poseidonia sp.]|tara:strand:+ start:1998 stop:4304 length:2307 start_codon:yes stop_codon:yes gene_type:complete
MGRQAWAIGTLCLLLCIGVSDMVSANQDLTYEPGFVEWDITPLERLYVEGLDVEEAVLQRGQTDSAIGGFTVGVTGGQVPVFTLQSPPVEQPVEAQVFMGVYFSAIIEGGGGPQSCTRQTWTDSSTTLTYSVSVSGTQLYSTEVTQTLDSSAENDAMNFSGEMQNVSLVMSPGDSITLSVSAEHRCLGTQARVQWGGFEHNSGGVIIEGVLYEPKASILVDAARLAHVELEHRLPWGLEDLRDEKWEIWGPLLPTDKSTRDGEYLVETSASRIRMTRDLGENNSVYTWSGVKPLPIGEMNLQFCLRTVAGDLNSDCHAEGILRFEVTGGDDGFASAGLWLTLTTVLALLGYVGNAFRTGLLLPVPILGALVALALLTLPTVFDQPNLGADATILENTKVLDAELTSPDGSSASISELLAGNEALVIGLVLPGSEQILTQSNEFNRSIDQLGDRVNVIHIVTGEDAMMSDVVSLAASTNASWKVYLDEKKAFANSLPTGAADAVVVVDPGMHVTFSQSSSAAMLDIVEAVDAITSGGPNSFGSYFGLLLGPGLFLFLLALPRNEWTAPEEPLPPGLLWGSIIVAAGAGILMINLPALLLTILPAGMTVRFLLDIAMMVWMLEMCFFTARRGAPYEADLLGRLLHRSFPKAFRDWREPVDMDRDVLLGIWMGWFGWLAFPNLFTQSVGSSILAGGSGIGMAIFFLLLFTFSGGLVVLLLRIVSSWGGPFSRLFGKFGGEVFAQFVGWILTPIALWMAINATITVFELGVL